ncbi:hypothetical protein DIPPA_05047 [Diplonema papillatum]|nr:hypothetical protein DIPPA_05047 [Diplonema papillatum]
MKRMQPEKKRKMATRRVVHDFTKRQLSATAADVARELREIEAEYRERVFGIRAHAGKPTFEANLQKAGRGRRRHVVSLRHGHIPPCSRRTKDGATRHGSAAAQRMQPEKKRKMATRRVVHDFTKRQLTATAADVARDMREIEAEYRERVSGIRAHANLQKAG